METHRTVWKFALNFGMTEFQVGEDAKIVHVGLDPQGTLCAWVEHGLTFQGDDVISAPLSATLRLDMVGTGYPIPKGGTHVGVYIDGPFVWHFYQAPMLTPPTADEVEQAFRAAVKGMDDES